ncbi:MAG TPA: hypothetical protein PL141_03380 [Thermoflexales bacterium]|nr:hypothetical protein [Thermoflexales bacterium]HQW34581.1 hypothetical protein [Thermoflexales bacterium]
MSTKNKPQQPKDNNEVENFQLHNLLDQSSYLSLSKAFTSLPIPTTAKNRINSIDVDERTFLSKVTFNEILTNPINKEELNLIAGALITLEALGIIHIEKKGERIWIWPTSEPAGYLLHSLSRLLDNYPGHKTPLSPDSSIKNFSSVIENALRDNLINPHLVLVNILESNRKEPYKQPLRRARVISVLIKGFRPKSTFSKAFDDVFLHVKKSGWDSYALVGSVQNSGESDIETALLALDEDLITSARDFTLISPNIKDEIYYSLSLNRGVFTQYEFNIFIAESLKSPLKLRGDLEYEWFTFEEICNQKSKLGLPIFTKAGLLKDIQTCIGLNNLPPIERHVAPIKNTSLRSQLKDIFLKVRGVFESFALFVKIFLQRTKWWFVSFVSLAITFLVIRPIIATENQPLLSNIGSLVSIFGFTITISGIIWNLIKTHPTKK